MKVLRVEIELVVDDGEKLSDALHTASERLGTLSEDYESCNTPQDFDDFRGYIQWTL